MLDSIIKEKNIQAIVIGAGLAGSECAWQLAEKGISTLLLEQRPLHSSPAHKTQDCAELVCSNSLKSTQKESAPRLLKEELTQLGSLILKSAYENQVPAGQALAVNRESFSKDITQAIHSHSKIFFKEYIVKSLDDVLKHNIPTVMATGPLTHEDLTSDLQKIIGEKLYFYDAIAPIIRGDSIDSNIAFLQNRYDKESSDGNTADYYNCPMNKEQYHNFIEEIKKAEVVPPSHFEKMIYFQGCQPIEAMIEKGDQTLRFGPLKPKGLTDPKTGSGAFAVVQLRKEDKEGRSWNMVGFQTKLKYPEQKRIFRMIPGLEKAQFYRFGSIHRNTFIHAPSLLNQDFSLKNHKNLYFAGQITGVEGYLESTAIGALVGRNIYRKLQNLDSIAPPQTTALGALAHATFEGRMKNYQPININWGLVPLKDIGERDKEKRLKLTERAQRHFNLWMGTIS